MNGGWRVDNPYRDKHHEFIDSNRELLTRRHRSPTNGQAAGSGSPSGRSGQRHPSPCSTTTPAPWRSCEGRPDWQCPGWSASTTRAGSVSWSSRSRTIRSAPTGSGSPIQAVTKRRPEGRRSGFGEAAASSAVSRRAGWLVGLGPAVRVGKASTLFAQERIGPRARQPGPLGHLLPGHRAILSVMAVLGEERPHHQPSGLPVLPNSG